MSCACSWAPQNDARCAYVRSVRVTDTNRVESLFNFKRIRFTKPSACMTIKAPSQAGEDLPQAVDLGVVAATSASTRSIDAVSALCCPLPLYRGCWSNQTFFRTAGGGS